MASHNKVTMIGRLVNDPSLVQLSNNNAVAKFSLASTRKYTSNNEKREETTFVDCELFGRRAEFLAQYGSKGREIFIEGRLRQDKWEDKATGANRSKLLVQVEDFDFLDRNPNSGPRADNEETEQPKTPARRGRQTNQQKQEVSQDDIPF